MSDRYKLDETTQPQDWAGGLDRGEALRKLGERVLEILRTSASYRSRADVADFIGAWMAAGGQSATPVSFGSLVSEDITLRDMVEMFGDADPVEAAARSLGLLGEEAKP